MTAIYYNIAQCNYEEVSGTVLPTELKLLNVNSIRTEASYASCIVHKT
jgi:hypothetical protein